MDRAGKLLRKLGIPGECLPAEDLVRAAWPQAVGKRVAEHTRAVALRGVRLIVEVEDPIWKSQLETLTSQILGRLNAAAATRPVEKIDFRVVPRRRGPQRAEQLRSAQDEASGIEDSALRMVYRASRKRSQA